VTTTGGKYGFVPGKVFFLPAVILLFLLITTEVKGQEPPPRPLEVNTTSMELSFGTFTLTGAGGTVTIYANGSRGAAGSIVLLNGSPSYSVTRLELTANPGTVVSLLSWPASTLSDGTHTMSFQIDSSLPALPLVITTTPPAATTLDLGATLNVGSLAANPAGYYTGTYNITFFQE
jgi:hypothetical protein